MLSRKAGGQPVAGHPGRVVAWDGRTFGPWAREIDGADAVINLAGRSVDCRYTTRHRREILDSRVDSTRVVGEAVSTARRPPPVWLQASTATIYAHRYDAANDERTGIVGGSEPGVPDTWRFSIEVARAWERALNEAPTPRTRKVAMRSAMTMSADRGSVFDVLRQLVRRGLGGAAGAGTQFVSWIHEDDFAAAIRFLIDRPDLAGPVNVSSPNPLPYREFMRGLRRACGVRVGLPAPAWLLEIGTFILRTESELVLKSRRVVPARLLDAGFVFIWPDWAAAAVDLCSRDRSPR